MFFQVFIRKSCGGLLFIICFRIFAICKNVPIHILSISILLEAMILANIGLREMDGRKMQCCQLTSWKMPIFSLIIFPNHIYLVLLLKVGNIESVLCSQMNPGQTLIVFYRNDTFHSELETRQVVSIIHKKSFPLIKQKLLTLLKSLNWQRMTTIIRAIHE